MATIELTNLISSQGFAYATWEGLSDGDVGQPFNYRNLADKTVQAIGISDGLIEMQGTLDPIAETDPDSAEWITLSNNRGEPATFDGAAGMQLLAEAPCFIRPKGSGGLTIATVAILANLS